MKKEFNIGYIDHIKSLLETIPKGPWHFSPGDDFNHWQIWSSDKITGICMVQDDSGVPPDKNFINFVLQSREIIEYLLKALEEMELSEPPWD